MWKLLGTDDATLRLILKTFFWIEADYYGFCHETGNEGANDPLLIVISFNHFFWTQIHPVSGQLLVDHTKYRPL